MPSDLEQLPEEVKDIIYFYLALPDLLTLREANKNFRNSIDGWVADTNQIDRNDLQGWMKKDPEKSSKAFKYYSYIHHRQDPIDGILTRYISKGKKQINRNELVNKIELELNTLEKYAQERKNNQLIDGNQSNDNRNQSLNLEPTRDVLVFYRAIVATVFVGVGFFFLVIANTVYERMKNDQLNLKTILGCVLFLGWFYDFFRRHLHGILIEDKIYMGNVIRSATNHSEIIKSKATQGKERMIYLWDRAKRVSDLSIKQLKDKEVEKNILVLPADDINIIELTENYRSKKHDI